MDKRILHDVLHDIAQQEIPDTMPSLWPSIQTQLNPTPRQRVVRLSRWGWVTALLIVSLMVSAGALAFNQIVLREDAALRRIQDQRLVTPIDERITIDGVTVTLEWAYADVHRAALAYTIADEAGDTPRQLAPTIQVLATADGQELPPMFGGFGGDGVLQQASASFDAAPLTGTTGDAALVFSVTLGEHDIPPAPSAPPQGDSAGGGGGGGGGGGNPDTASPATADNSPPPGVPLAPGTEPVGPFVFEFSVPVYSAQVVEPDQDATVEDVTLTLTRAAYAPSLTRLTLCTDALHIEENWFPVVSLDTGAEIVESNGSSPLMTGDGRLCYDLDFLAPYERTATTWTLTVSRMERTVLFAPEEIAAALAEYGIEVVVEENGRWYTTYVPDDIDFSTVLREATTESFGGPWTFTLDVPGS